MSRMGWFIQKAKPFVERVPLLATAYRMLRDLQWWPAVPRPTPLGFRFAGHSEMCLGRFEPDETLWIKRLLPNAGLFVNVGANTGYYCCIALHSGLPVLAFEPLRANLRRLYRNVLANDWQERIRVLPVALADRSGLLDMYGGGTTASLLPGWDGVRRFYRRTVPVFTFDELAASQLQEHRALILVDVEGAERAVLAGAQRIVNQTPRPIWVVEVNVSEHQPQGRVVNPDLLPVFEVFWAAGYSAWTATHPPRKVQPEDLQRIIRGGSDTLGTHNFLFAMPQALNIPEDA